MMHTSPLALYSSVSSLEIVCETMLQVVLPLPEKSCCFLEGERLTRKKASLPVGEGMYKVLAGKKIVASERRGGDVA